MANAVPKTYSGEDPNAARAWYEEVVKTGDQELIEALDEGLDSLRRG